MTVAQTVGQTVGQGRRVVITGMGVVCPLGLTLEDLGIVEQSLVKSLTAVYHGRVKYPDQRTA